MGGIYIIYLAVLSPFILNAFICWEEEGGMFRSLKGGDFFWSRHVKALPDVE